MKFKIRLLAASMTLVLLSGGAVDGMSKTAVYGGIGVLAGAATGAGYG